MRVGGGHDFLLVEFLLVVIHDAVDHYFAAFQMPVHVAREPQAFRRPHAGEFISEFPQHTDEAAENAHRFGQVQLRLREGIILLVHPHAASGFVDELVRKRVHRQIITGRLEIHHQRRPAIEQLPARSMERLQRVDDAVNALISPDVLRREFLGHERLANTLYGAVKPAPAALEFAGRVACLGAIAEAIRAKLNPNPTDITVVMGKIAETLDDSITGVDMPTKPAPVIDLSKINFAALRDRFKESKHKNTDLEQLKAAIRAQLDKLIRLNRSRADYLAKFEELIEAYNNGSRNIEQILEDLLQFAGSLSAEQERHVREHMSEEELTVFDILTRPGPELSPAEREEVKKVARQVLERLKTLLALDWRRQTQARAQVRLAIEDTLDTGLPRPYTKELYQGKCSALFEHVFESYQGEGASIYTAAA